MYLYCPNLLDSTLSLTHLLYKGQQDEAPSSNSLSRIQGLCWREKLNNPCPQFSTSDWDEGGEDGPQTRRPDVRKEKNSFERRCDFIPFSSEHMTQSSRSDEANCASFSDDRGSTRGLLALKAIWEKQMFMFYWTLTLSLFITTFLYLLYLFT